MSPSRLNGTTINSARNKNLAIRSKILGTITLLLFLTVAFYTVYFPLEQKEQVTAALQDKAGSALEMLTSGVALALREGDFTFVDKLFTLVRSDSGIVYLAIVDASGQPLIAFNPDSVAIPKPDSNQHQGILEYGGILHTWSVLQIDEGEAGAMTMGFSLRQRDAEINNIRLKSISISAVILVFGLLLAIKLSKLAEERLQAAHLETERLLASISSILIGVGPDDRITRWNEVAEQSFGIKGTHVVGKSFLKCGIQWDWNEVDERISECRDKDKPTSLHDVRFTRANGREGFLDITINPIQNDARDHAGYLLLATEITERKNLESQLSQAQKLESIGQLAAGIAHEINTPIQYVGDNTRFLDTAFARLKSVLDKNQQLLKAAKEDSLTEQLIAEAESAIEENKMEYMVEEIPMAIEETLGGVERVATIVRAMKEFSHPGTAEKTLTDINKALENTITVACNEWKYVAEMVKDFEPSLPLVPCLPGELNQVFLNIIVNAAHAIDDVVGNGSGGKGVIKVSTSNTRDRVEIRISDSGTGIPEEVCSKVFDPFFTTKEIGKGTGQGLAIAHNVVVEKHGGSMNFETEIGKGTTFVIRLPITPVSVGKVKSTWEELS